MIKGRRHISHFVQKLRKVILEDELGICADLDALMDNLVNSYEDEWATVVKGIYIHSWFLPPTLILIIKDPAKHQQFKQFVNTEEQRPQAELINQRGQTRPADWPKATPSTKFSADQLITPKSEWRWIKVASKGDMMPSENGATSVAVLYGDTQLAVYHVPKRGYYATQQM